MTKVAVLTAIYGDYDRLKPLPPQTVPCEHIVVTDRECPDVDACVIVDPMPELSRRMAAKYPKCRPDRYTDADYVIWIDGSVRVIEPTFVEWLLDNANCEFISAFRHPERATVIEEADACIVLGADDPERLTEQRDHYLRYRGIFNGFEPDQYGLYACGVMVRNCTDRFIARQQRFGDTWLMEQRRFTTRDQISFPFVSWLTLSPIHTLPSQPDRWFGCPGIDLEGHR